MNNCGENKVLINFLVSNGIMVLYNDPSYLLKSFSMISPKHPCWMTSWPPGLCSRSQQPLGCKSGLGAKEVEFLRSLHSVCLTFLMGLGLHFPLNCHWKHLLEKFSIPHTNSTGNITWIALFSSCKWRSLGSSHCNSAHLRLSVDALLPGSAGNPQSVHPAIQNLCAE